MLFTLTTKKNSFKEAAAHEIFFVSGCSFICLQAVSQLSGPAC